MLTTRAYKKLIELISDFLLFNSIMEAIDITCSNNYDGGVNMEYALHRY